MTIRPRAQARLFTFGRTIGLPSTAAHAAAGHGTRLRVGPPMLESADHSVFNGPLARP